MRRTWRGGVLVAEARYDRRGRRHGLQRSWYGDSGALRSVENFRHGTKDGWQFEFWPHGAPASAHFLSAGLSNGVLAFWDQAGTLRGLVLTEHGQFCHSTVWAPTGALVMDNEYVNGVLRGQVHIQPRGLRWFRHFPEAELCVDGQLCFADATKCAVSLQWSTHTVVYTPTGIQKKDAAGRLHGTQRSHGRITRYEHGALTDTAQYALYRRRWVLFGRRCRVRVAWAPSQPTARTPAALTKT